MCARERHTATVESIPVSIVGLDDEYATISWLASEDHAFAPSAFGRSETSTEPAGVARSPGVHGVRATMPAEATAATADATERDGPTPIEVPTDPRGTASRAARVTPRSNVHR